MLRVAFIAWKHAQVVWALAAMAFWAPSQPQIQLTTHMDYKNIWTKMPKIIFGNVEGGFHHWGVGPNCMATNCHGMLGPILPPSNYTFALHKTQNNSNQNAINHCWQ